MILVRPLKAQSHICCLPSRGAKRLNSGKQDGSSTQEIMDQKKRHDSLDLFWYRSLPKRVLVHRQLYTAPIVQTAQDPFSNSSKSYIRFAKRISSMAENVLAVIRYEAFDSSEEDFFYTALANTLFMQKENLTEDGLTHESLQKAIKGLFEIPESVQGDKQLKMEAKLQMILGLLEGSEIMVQISKEDLSAKETEEWKNNLWRNFEKFVEKILNTTRSKIHSQELKK
jgi:hypothetical protein